MEIRGLQVRPFESHFENTLTLDTDKNRILVTGGQANNPSSYNISRIKIWFLVTPEQERIIFAR